MQRKVSQNPKDTSKLLFGVALLTLLQLAYWSIGIMELSRVSLETSQVKLLNIMDEVSHLKLRIEILLLLIKLLLINIGSHSFLPHSLFGKGLLKNGHEGRDMNISLKCMGMPIKGVGHGGNGKCFRRKTLLCKKNINL